MNASRMIGLFFLAMAVHWLWVSHFSLWGLSPQVLLVLTVTAAARWGSVSAMCLGFLWGLFLDVLNVRLFGGNALALTLIGYGTGSLRRQLDMTGLAPQCFVVFLMTWVYFLLLGLLGVVFARGFLWAGWAQFFLAPFYNVIVASVLFEGIKP